MNFKRHWGCIWQLRACAGVLFLVISILSAWFVSMGAYKVAIVAFVSAVIVACFLLIIIHVLPGYMTDEITIDEDGILLYQKNMDSIMIKWSHISSIIKTRKFGTNVLAVIGFEGDVVWFYTNRKIIKYILLQYPRAKELLFIDMKYTV